MRYSKRSARSSRYSSKRSWRMSYYARTRKRGLPAHRRWRPRHPSKRDHGVRARVRVVCRTRIVEVQRPHVHIVPDASCRFWRVYTFSGTGRWLATQRACTKPEAQKIAAAIRRRLRREYDA